MIEHPPFSMRHVDTVLEVSLRLIPTDPIVESKHPGGKPQIYHIVANSGPASEVSFVRSLFGSFVFLPFPSMLPLISTELLQMGEIVGQLILNMAAGFRRSL